MVRALGSLDKELTAGSGTPGMEKLSILGFGALFDTRARVMLLVFVQLGMLVTEEEGIPDESDLIWKQTKRNARSRRVTISSILVV